MDWLRTILVEHSALQAVMVISLISLVGIGLGKIRFSAFRSERRSSSSWGFWPDTAD